MLQTTLGPGGYKGRRPTEPSRMAAPQCAGGYIAGYGQFVGGRADILCGVVENEVFEMHQLTDPQRGAGVGNVHAFDPALADRRAGDALVGPAQMSESTSPAPAIEFMND